MCASYRPKADSHTMPVASGSRASHSDDGLPLSVSRSDVIERLGGIAQSVGLVDDRCDLPCFDEFLENNQVLFG